ncbi:toprim domain-containing protein [Opitutales bacterium]|nr:toprim domain-containing protein [Opitutales bacterium]
MSSRHFFLKSISRWQDDQFLSLDPAPSLQYRSQAGRPAPCGVYGTNSLKDDYITKIASSQVEDVVIAYDNDKAGNEAAHLAAKKLKKENIRSQRFKLPAGYDVNQYLTNP